MWRVQPGAMINGRYRVQQEAGRGSFACVQRCEDKQGGGQVAVKLLERQYARDAAREMDVLKAISRHDTDDRKPIVKMLSNFTWEGLPCIVFKMHGPSLRQRRLGGGDKAQLARLAHQVASALTFLHVNCRVVHTDLKPENILLDRDEPTGAGLGNKFVVCDLGSASFYTERVDSELITTRPYRAVEVLLCNGWTWTADNWSLGCILYEAHVGTPLFECARYCDSDEQHIQAMQKRLGTLPQWLAEAATGRGRGLVRGRFGGDIRPSPFAAADRSTMPLGERLGADKDLHDFISRLIDYDPYQRLRSDEVQYHPFLTTHYGKASGNPSVNYPPSALSAGRLATSGIRQRPPAGQLRDKNAAETPRTVGTRSCSARAGSRGEALRDVTNRLPVHQMQKRDPGGDAAPNTGRQPRSAAQNGGEGGWSNRPRSGSVSAGSRGPLRGAAVEPWLRPAAGAYMQRAPW